MAKRKRLTPANPSYLPDDQDGKAPLARKGPLMGSAPISAVAGDAAATAALAELADTIAKARASGRMVIDLPLDVVATGYLVRDRAHIDEEDMDALMASLRSRGQQTPIEVVEQSDGTFGLISGWRRLEALRRLRDDGSKTDSVQALLRDPADASAAYIAMVEENEIRSDLSFYERARIVVKSVEQGVYDSEKLALKALFKSAPRARRSKIGSFIPVVRALDGMLAYPHALSEKNGLTLSKALASNSDLRGEIAEKLMRMRAGNGTEEWVAIERALYPKEISLDRSAVSVPAVRVVDGLYMKLSGGKIEITGPKVSPALRTKLADWLKSQG